MKAIYLVPLAAALLLTACDPGYTSVFAIDNRTSHDLTIQSLQPYDTVNHHYAAIHPLSAPAHTDSVVWVTGGLGGASLVGIAHQVCWHSYGDSVQIRFDDGRTLNYYMDSTGADALYSFDDANTPASLYRYEERPNTSGPFKGNISYCKLTLVVTDSLYNLSR
ncbi:MAG: hypothetical protein IJ785_08205 [Bacteroidales bacterium]|nr:hypothetical protein [Bacteroidales bacterium]